MEKYCRLIPDNYLKYSEYGEVVSNFDGYFPHYYPGIKNGNAAPFKLSGQVPQGTIAYMSWIHSSEQLKKQIELHDYSQYKIIIFANEYFLDNGKPRGKIDLDFIEHKFWTLKKAFPDSQLWITDYRPRSLKLWNGLRNFIKERSLPVDGIGIHCYLELDRPVSVEITIAAYLQSIKIQCWMNRKIAPIAFSEVGVFPGSDPAGLASGYNALMEAAIAERVEWMNYWAPTDYDSFHWIPSKLRDCGLYDRSFTLKPGLTEPWHHQS
jgi:hypothetical protein